MHILVLLHTHSDRSDFAPHMEQALQALCLTHTCFVHETANVNFQKDTESESEFEPEVGSNVSVQDIGRVKAPLRVDQYGKAIHMYTCMGYIGRYRYRTCTYVSTYTLFMYVDLAGSQFSA
jgi:hypothetical protein